MQSKLVIVLALTVQEDTDGRHRTRPTKIYFPPSKSYHHLASLPSDPTITTGEDPTIQLAEWLKLRSRLSEADRLNEAARFDDQLAKVPVVRSTLVRLGSPHDAWFQENSVYGTTRGNLQTHCVYGGLVRGELAAAWCGCNNVVCDQDDTYYVHSNTGRNFFYTRKCCRNLWKLASKPRGKF